MTPAARIQAAIDLLNEIDAAAVPADWVMAAYMRERRYIGAKDRRAIGDLVYTVLRRRARLGWWLAGAGAGGGPDGWRRAVIAALVMAHERALEEIDSLFDGAPHHPAPLSPLERAAARALSGRPLDHSAQPPCVRGELPEWLMPAFAEAFGPRLDAELAALTREAPLDLRVNTLKAGRTAARAALAEAGIATEPTPLSPLGLRVTGRRALTGTRAFEDGLIEVQDEGSQVIALLTDARPGMTVADVCAGAGGKTLALAAAMENRGRLVALDVQQKRLDRAARRLRRAGVGIVERRRLRGDSWLTSNARRFDRVLVDAPCSGSGAWRRNPDARWRLTRKRLEAYHAAQAEVLARAARLVRPGGRLVYATCSLLPSENERQVEAFLARRPEFAPLPAGRVWAEALGAGMAPPPEPSPFRDGRLVLTPGRHGTDGFFAAVLGREEGR